MDAYWRCYEWTVGRVLTASDVADIQQVLNDYNDEIGTQAEHYNNARAQVLFEIGGQALVDAEAAATDAACKVSLERALAHYYAERAKHEAMLQPVSQPLA